MLYLCKKQKKEEKGYVLTYICAQKMLLKTDLFLNWVVSP